MSKRRVLVAALAALSGLGASAPSGVGASALGTHVLSSQVVPGLASAVAVTPQDPSARTEVVVALDHANPAGEAAAAAAVNDPSSPSYRQFYTPQSWAASFALPMDRYQAIATQLTAHGLSTGYASPTRDLVVLSGTVGAVEATFGVHLNTYTTADGHVFHANAEGPTVPDGVSAVLGLEDVSRKANSQGICIQHVCGGAFQAQDLWTAYDLPAGNTGTGEKVAIIGEGAIAPVISDLRQFETERSLPRVNVRSVPVLDDLTDVSGQLEWDIDSQASTGMAPGVDELAFYFAQSLGVTSGAFSAWVNDPNGAHQANASFGGCESLNIALGSVVAEQPIFQQAAAEGRTVFVATGDTGGSCTAVTGNGVINTGAPQVEWPAASRWVVAVGGTMLYTDGANRIVEKAWEYTGGGSSISQPRPAWQAGTAVIKDRCLVNGGGQPVSPTPCRGLPDVAALSGDIATEGLWIVNAGTDNIGAGTSLSSPLWMGMWTRVQAAHAGGLGFAAPLLYGVGNNPAQDANDFYDIALGSNGQYTAIPRSTLDPNGWDFVSGLGVPDVAKLMGDLAGTTAPATSTPAPSVADSVVSPTWQCGPNGEIDGTAGDTIHPPVDLVRSTLALSGANLVATFNVAHAGGPNHVLDYFMNFSYLGKGYSLQLEQQSDLGVGTWLNDSAGNALISGPGGGIDLATNSITVSVPVAQFNSVVKPTTPLGAGSVLKDLDAQTNYDLLPADDDPAPGCSATL